MPQVVDPDELAGRVKGGGLKGTISQAADFDVLQLMNV